MTARTGYIGMQQEFYINFKCLKCNRYSSTVVRGALHQAKSVGCKICGQSTTISLRDTQNIKVGDLEITSGIYYYCDS